MSRRVVVLGRQGAGKGTQAVRLAEALGVPHLSTGDMLRAAVRAGTELGRRARDYLEAGELVPDEVVTGLVAERLGEPDAARGFVLDGFPRTRSQAESLERTLPAGGGVEAVVDLEVPTDVAIDRLSSRRVCSGCGAIYSLAAPPGRDWRCDACGGEVVQRSDDTPEAIARRLALYDAETVPLVDFYRSRVEVVGIDGVGPPDEVFDRVLAAVGAPPGAGVPGGPVVGGSSPT